MLCYCVWLVQVCVFMWMYVLVVFPTFFIFCSLMWCTIRLQACVVNFPRERKTMCGAQETYSLVPAMCSTSCLWKSPGSLRSWRTVDDDDDDDDKVSRKEWSRWQRKWWVTFWKEAVNMYRGLVKTP